MIRGRQLEGNSFFVIVSGSSASRRDEFFYFCTLYSADSHHQSMNTTLNVFEERKDMQNRPSGNGKLATVS